MPPTHERKRRADRKIPFFDDLQKKGILGQSGASG